MRATAASGKDQDRLLQRCEPPWDLPGAVVRLPWLHLPAVSKKAGKQMRLSVRRWRLHLRNDLALEDVAAWVRPVLTGWVRYYGRFYPSELQEELRTIDAYIVRWAARKYKRFKGHTLATWDWLRSLKRR